MGEFKAEVREKINVIECPAVIGPAELNDLVQKIKQWSGQGVIAHVFNFLGCEEIPQGMFRCLVFFKRNISVMNARIFSVGMSKKLVKEVRNAGLDALLNPVADMDAVLVALGLKKPAGKGAAAAPPAIGADSLEFIKPFVAAVEMAIGTQGNTPVKRGAPFPKKGEYDVTFGIAGVINLVSPQFVGSISLLFPEKVFIDIYFNMLDEKIDTITKESEDAAAELLNIIFGLAKMKLNNEKGFAIEKAIPTVLVGDKLRVALSRTGTTVALPFETKAGKFFVEVVFEGRGSNG